MASKSLNERKNREGRRARIAGAATVTVFGNETLTGLNAQEQDIAG